MRKKIFAFLLLPFLLACSHVVKKNPEGPRTLLFPYGEYRHDVHVHLVKAPEKGPQEMDFHGVVSLQKEKILMLGLSPFGTTLFRVEENRESGDIQIESSIDAIKKHEDRIKNFYKAIREVLTLPISGFEQNPFVQVLGRNEKGFPSRFHMKSSQGSLNVDLLKFDAEDIPREIDLDSENFSLKIKVTGYEI
jgi:hypothetical protein